MVVTAAYIQNRGMCVKIPKNMTPFEMSNGGKPDVASMRVFGSRRWYHTGIVIAQKLQDRKTEVILIGYASRQRSYKF